MSIRPSRAIRELQASVVPTHFVLIGNTVLNTLYSAKIFETFKNLNPRPTIWVMTSGANLMTDVNVESLNYIARNNATIGKGIETIKLHLVPNSAEPVASVLDPSQVLIDLYYDYYYGTGPNGDFTTSYRIPEIGPWFTSDSSGKIQEFAKNNTIQYPWSNNEKIAGTNLASLLHLTMTNAVVATRPSILTHNNIFVYHEGTKLERQIYRNLYVDLTNESSINTVNHVNNLYVTPSTNSTCFENMTYTTVKVPTSVTVSDACVLWMSNLYTYVKILGLSDSQFKKIQQPSYYRVVYAINLVNPNTGINLSNLPPNEYPLNVGDGVTSRITFACTDVPEPGESMNNTSIQWLVTAYTCAEDFANPGAGGTFAAPGKSLLIVEAISLTNRRTLSWDALHTSVNVALNSNSVELGRYGQFLLISANVYYAYTGTFPTLPIAGETVCSVQGVCTDFVSIHHAANRESPIEMVLRLLTTLYGGTTYPVPHSHGTTTQCCG